MRIQFFNECKVGYYEFSIAQNIVMQLLIVYKKINPPAERVHSFRTIRYSLENIIGTQEIRLMIAHNSIE